MSHIDRKVVKLYVPTRVSYLHMLRDWKAVTQDAPTREVTFPHARRLESNLSRRFSSEFNFTYPPRPRRHKLSVSTRRCIQLVWTNFRLTLKTLTRRKCFWTILKKPHVRNGAKLSKAAWLHSFPTLHRTETSLRYHVRGKRLESFTLTVEDQLNYRNRPYRNFATCHDSLPLPVSQTTYALFSRWY